MKKILILNRRDILNPLSGGAEKYTFEIAKALLEKNFEVHWFSSKFKGSKDEEFYNGIKIIRKGNELFTHFWGFIYALKNRKNYYLIIDEFNGIGFFTFFLKNSILLVHQLYQEFWIYEMGKLFFFMKYIEKVLLSLYRKKFTITVSNSTFQDLKLLKFENVHIVENGIDQINYSCEKENSLNLCFLGRLRKTKNPEEAIEIFLKVKNFIKDAKMLVIGSGPLETYLKNNYKNERDLKFLGYLNEEEKFKNLCKSHFLIVPSIREGWGIVVIEANSVGVPVIGYDVPGLRDSIKNGLNGFLVKDLKSAVDKIIEVWNNKELYYKLCESSKNYARNYSWEITRKKFLKVISENFNAL